MALPLNQRYRDVMRKVIEIYFANAEPVGSHILAEQFHHAISPATIRHAMADLEDMGYL